MVERSGNFWRFQFGYWGIAGLLLFSGGLSHLPFEVAFVRNVYFPIAGFLTSFFLIILFEKLKFLNITAHWISIILSSSFVAIVCTVVVNPITYTQLGNDFASIPLTMVFAGIGNFILYYLLWAALYFHMVDGSILKKPTATTLSENQNLLVEKGGKIVPLNILEISHIKAAGDYVEIFVGDDAHIHKSTLGAIMEKLKGHSFIRIHRSAIVHLPFVTSLTSQPKGEYLVTLKNDTSLKASKTYSVELKDKLNK